MYWVFTEEQLEAALNEYYVRRENGPTALLPSALIAEINEFLHSPEAKHHKLQGGASYEPEETA